MFKLHTPSYKVPIHPPKCFFEEQAPNFIACCTQIEVSVNLSNIQDISRLQKRQNAKYTMERQLLEIKNKLRAHGVELSCRLELETGCNLIFHAQV